MSVKNAPKPKIIKQFKDNRQLINLRKITRVDIRKSDGLVAMIFSKERDLKIPGAVYDLTNFGASLVISKSEAQLLARLKEVYVEFNCSWGPSFGRYFVICWFENFKIDQTRIGLRVDERMVPSDIGNIEDMVEVPHNYPLVGYIYKDFFYYEKSIIKLLAISRERALVEILDDESLFFTGQEVQILFSLQTMTLDRLNGTVQRAELTKDRRLRIEISNLQVSDKLQQDLVNHLVQNTALDLEKIRKAGFKITHVSNNFRFRYVKTHEEYLQVLNLRFRAYQEAGKVSEGATKEDMAAPLDHISRIFTCYHGHKLIASVAVSFPESDDVILDTERPLENGYPKEFPDKKSVIEISRLCTDPKYRRGDVLVRIFQHIYKVFGSSSREYLITSTDDKLWPLYKSLGFAKTAYSYAHLYLNGIKHHIIIAKKTTGTEAKNISLLRWNYLYRDMTFYMLDRKNIKINSFVKFKLYIWSWVGRLLRIKGSEKY